MKKEPVQQIIEGKPYPKAAGAYFGYRCCVNGEWYDCDQHGNITDRRYKEEGAKKAWLTKRK